MTISTPRRGKKIFGCEKIFDHAAKLNQSKYPWAQNIVTVGLLKIVKGRWACLPLSYRFYHLKKSIARMHRDGGPKLVFTSKLAMAVDMITDIAASFGHTRIIVTTDSWFGNNGLWKPLHDRLGIWIDMISRLRSNSNLFELPGPQSTGAGGPSPKIRPETRQCGIDGCLLPIPGTGTHRQLVWPR